VREHACARVPRSPKTKETFALNPAQAITSPRRLGWAGLGVTPSARVMACAWDVQTQEKLTIKTPALGLSLRSNKGWLFWACEDTIDCPGGKYVEQELKRRVVYVSWEF